MEDNLRLAFNSRPYVLMETPGGGGGRIAHIGFEAMNCYLLACVSTVLAGLFKIGKGEKV